MPKMELLFGHKKEVIFWDSGLSSVTEYLLRKRGEKEGEGRRVCISTP